jgi:hypothetical protein
VAITIPENVTSIGEWAFAFCSSLTDIVLPASLTTIEVGAFAYCHGLTALTIPNGVTTIGLQAFYNCISLTDMVFPNSVTEIGREVFVRCTSLASVTIPGSVTEIKDGIFAFCSGLTSVTVGWMTPRPVTGEMTFLSVPLSSATLHVPIGTKALYEAADGWKDFGTILEDVVVDVSTELIPSSGVQIRLYGNLLSVDSPASEQVSVYSVGGQLLYSAQKASGSATFDLNSLPSGVLIVKGSSGWTKKIFK